MQTAETKFAREVAGYTRKRLLSQYRYHVPAQVQEYKISEIAVAASANN
jgi:hypothetical protein